MKTAITPLINIEIQNLNTIAWHKFDIYPAGDGFEVHLYQHKAGLNLKNGSAKSF
jgi:hypothetical protein